MRHHRTASFLLVLATLGVSIGLAEAAPRKSQIPARRAVANRVAHPHLSLRYAAMPGSARPGRLVSLVGDRDSGLGFYPLPRQFRSAGPRFYGNRPGDAIRYAVASEVGSAYYYGVGGDVYGDRHHHAMFNPVDGYGTPFFAGYYGPAGDPDDDHGPFGQPYN